MCDDLSNVFEKKLQDHLKQFQAISDEQLKKIIGNGID